MKNKPLLLVLLPILFFFGCDKPSGELSTLSYGSSNGTTKTVTSNEISTFEGMGYEFWTDSGKGTMKIGENGVFECTWDSSGNKNILFRRGTKYSSPLKPHTGIGKISVEYAATYSPGISGISYFCVYGWTRDTSLPTNNPNRLVEYYIIDNWSGFYSGGTPNAAARPPGNWEESLTRKGTLEVDGGIYDIWTSVRTDKPSIDGNRTFMQYWSVRQDKRLSGTIDVSAHFNEWNKLGMPMGGLYEVALTVEGFNNVGSAKITKNILKP